MSEWMTPLPTLTRVNVVGPSGSGKSTIGRRLAGLLGVLYVQMDQLFWEPGWTEAADAVFLARLERAIEGERWVLDGNYHRTAPIKWPRTTTVVWLDYVLPRVLWQASERAVRRALSGQELWPDTGNRESLGRLFSRKSALLFSLRTHGSHRARYRREQAQPSWPQLHFVRLRSPREAAAFLRAVERSLAPATFAASTRHG
jgi:adenylate kinase family enzyme